jgi:hypothetical protein
VPKGPVVMLISAVSVVAIVAAFHFGPRVLGDADIFSGVTRRGAPYVGTSPAIEFLLMTLLLAIALVLSLRHAWKRRKKGRERADSRSP